MNAAPRRDTHGPASSRRLGQSLGIGLVFFTTCSFDCLHCRPGRVSAMGLPREESAEKAT